MPGRTRRARPAGIPGTWLPHRCGRSLGGPAGGPALGIEPGEQGGDLGHSRSPGQAAPGERLRQAGLGQLAGRPDRGPDGRCRPGQPGRGQQGDDAQRLGPGVQHGVQGEVITLLGQLPRLALGQVAGQGRLGGGVGTRCRLLRGHLGLAGEAEVAVQEAATRAYADAKAALDGDLAYERALAAIWRLVGAANGYLSERKPWELAKQGDDLALDTVLYTGAEALRIIALLTASWLTRTAPAIWAAVGAPGELAEARLPEALTWGGLPRGARVTKVAALFPRLDAEGRATGGASQGPPAAVG